VFLIGALGKQRPAHDGRVSGYRQALPFGLAAQASPAKGDYSEQLRVRVKVSSGTFPRVTNSNVI
jgi:hypothetical protein